MFVRSHHQLYRLQHLNLSCCFYLENETCNEILVKLTQLREYMIRECFRVTEKGLMAALFHPTLFYLDVSGTAVNLRYVAAIRGSALTGCLTVIAERCPPTARQDGITWT
ncbi:hypothetical protein LSAT2_005397 [Lamellibrachia satsuma]|nr:hypothetical protein LSAT2_005397 [Lamellibrachia satsuma]